MDMIMNMNMNIFQTIHPFMNMKNTTNEYDDEYSEYEYE